MPPYKTLIHIYINFHYCLNHPRDNPKLTQGVLSFVQISSSFHQDPSGLFQNQK